MSLTNCRSSNLHTLSKMSMMAAPQQKLVNKPAPLSEINVKNTPRTLYNTVDSAVSMTFPENVESNLANFENSEDQSKMDSQTFDIAVSSTKASDIVFVEGMPFRFSKIMEMGNALTKARRERNFPTTITPTYNLKAVIDDYEDLERLNAARECAVDTRDDAFRPDVASLYVKIQRRIQDRDLTHGEVAAESNVRARLSGFANSTGAETGMYNLMRHAVNSVLRLNNLTADSDSNVVDTAAARVVDAVRTTVQDQASRGANGVTEQNMENVLEHVFSTIESALGDRVESQADRLDANATRFDATVSRADDQINAMNNLTTAQNAQVSAIASHVGAIDNHVHAMGNNVNAMGSLVNSTNGNVTSLTANITILQTILNTIPQMVANAVAEILPNAIHGAVEEAFEAAISNDLFNRMQVFVNTVEEARARVAASERPPSYSGRNKNRSWFGKLNIFKKRNGRRSCPPRRCAA